MAQNVTAFAKARAADLTPYLGGDAVKDYPNLAAMPTYSWKNASCARDGKLYMVPISRYLPGNMLLKNTEVYDAEIGKDYVPKDAADFKRILQALTKPQQNRFGMGPINNRPDMIAYVSAMFGAPKELAARRRTASCSKTSRRRSTARRSITSATWSWRACSSPMGRASPT